MSRVPIFVSDLEIGNQVWKMGVKVHDMWTVKERNGGLHVELIIVDAKVMLLFPIKHNIVFNRLINLLLFSCTHVL